MNRMTTGICFAAAVGLAATLGAQSPTSTTSRPMTADKDHEVTLTGCLSKASGGFMLTNARMDTDKSSSTTTAPGSTTTASGSSTTTSATGTTGSTREGAASMTASTWMLSGDSDLEKHVGHKITVTGKTESNGAMDHGRTAATSTSGAGTTAAGSTSTTTTSAEPRLDVKSIKMVSSSCP